MILRQGCILSRAEKIYDRVCAVCDGNARCATHGLFFFSSHLSLVMLEISKEGLEKIINPPNKPKRPLFFSSAYYRRASDLCLTTVYAPPIFVSLAFSYD